MELALILSLAANVLGIAGFAYLGWRPEEVHEVTRVVEKVVEVDKPVPAQMAYLGSGSFSAPRVKI